VRAFHTGGGAINPWPHRGQVKLTCASFGQGDGVAAIDRKLAKILTQESGWLVFNTHGDGRRRLESHPGLLLGTAAGTSVGHQVGGNPAGGSRLGNVRRLSGT
jgi:hypothetical protein